MQSSYPEPPPEMPQANVPIWNRRLSKDDQDKLKEIQKYIHNEFVLANNPKEQAQARHEQLKEGEVTMTSNRDLYDVFRASAALLPPLELGHSSRIPNVRLKDIVPHDNQATRVAESVSLVDPMVEFVVESAPPLVYKTPLDEQSAEELSKQVQSAPTFYEPGPFLKFCRLFSRSGVYIKLQFMLEHMQEEHLMCLAKDTEMVATPLINAHAEIQMVRATRKNSTARDTIATFSPSMWGTMGTSDAGSYPVDPARLQAWIAEYMTRANGVLEHTGVPSGIDGDRTWKLWPTYSHLKDRAVTTALFPMCIGPDGTDEETKHWILVIVLLKRRARAVRGTCGVYYSIKDATFIAYDPFVKKANPYISKEALLFAVDNVRTFVLAFDTYMSMESRKEFEHSVGIVNGLQGGGLTCGLWVMSAMSYIFAVHGNAKFLRAPLTNRVYIVEKCLSQVTLQDAWRAKYMHRACVEMIQMFRNFPFAQKISSPFTLLVEKEEKDNAEARQKEANRQERLAIAARKASLSARNRRKSGPLEPFPIEDLRSVEAWEAKIIDESNSTSSSSNVHPMDEEPPARPWETQPLNGFQF